jgi:hypothetical protein
MTETNETEQLKTWFKDEQGRQWNLKLTIGKAMQLRDEMNLDVNQLIDPNSGLLHELMVDSWKLLDILLLITRDERKQISVSDEDFANALGGETLDEATEAFLYGVTSSLKKLQRRAFAAMTRQLSTATEMAAQRVVSQIQKNEEKIGERLDSAIGSLSSDPPVS